MTGCEDYQQLSTFTKQQKQKIFIQIIFTMQFTPVCYVSLILTLFQKHCCYSRVLMFASTNC